MAHTAESRTAVGAQVEAQPAARGPLQPVRPGATLWLTGLPSAGKSTLATALAEQLRAEGRAVEVLDGDEVRRHLTAELGFSREHRDLNVARVGYVAELLARHGVLVLVAVIAPYAGARDTVRKIHEHSGTAFAEVYVATPVQVCKVRDVKGLYAKQAAGEISGLTGVDDPYEVPQFPELVLETQSQQVPESLQHLRALLTRMGAV
jgi:adenylylsulfate kinase